MTSELPEDVVADALARMRARGGWRGGGGGLRGAAAAGPSGSRDGERDGGRAGRGGPFSAGGGPALRRLVARLAATGVPLSVSDISIEVGVDQPRASRLVAQGVEMGLLRREADPDDARRTRIVLTDEGRQHAAHLREKHKRAVLAALEGFSDSERQQFAALLERFVDAWPGGHRS